MYSAYMLTKQGDNIQSCHTPLPILSQSVVPCKVLTLASWSEYKSIELLVEKKKKKTSKEIYKGTVKKYWYVAGLWCLGTNPFVTQVVSDFLLSTKFKK